MWPSRDIVFHGQCGNFPTNLQLTGEKISSEDNSRVGDNSSGIMTAILLLHDHLMQTCHKGTQFTQDFRFIGEKYVVVCSWQLYNACFRCSGPHGVLPPIAVGPVGSVYLFKCGALFIVLRLKSIVLRPTASGGRNWGNRKKCKYGYPNL